MVAGYLSDMQKVQKSTADAATATEKLAKQGEAFSRVGRVAMTFGAAMAAGVLIAVKSAADFEAQMSKVQAATNATAADMNRFRNQALTAGAAFGYTATQVTEAQVELGKAGLATKDILGDGLTGVLALAASDNVELGKATQIAAVAMKQFNLEGSDVPHIADLLAAGAGKALGGVEQLGDALNQSGLVASNFGFSIEETTGVLSAFADAGLLGSDAGTSLKSMLQMLANPSKESAQLMKSLGINVEDANGQFLGAAEIADVLKDRLSGLSDAQRQQALSQLFGADAVRAATVLYKEGADGIQAYIDQNNDAGYAVEQARIKSNNLNGDLKKLSSAFQSGLIKAGTDAEGGLRPLVQTITGVVTAFSQLPQPVQTAAVGIGALLAAVGLLGGGMLTLVPKIAEARAALAALQISGKSAALGIGLATVGIGAAVVAFGTYAQWQGEIAGNAQELSGTLDSQTGKVTANTRAWIAQELANSGAYKAAKEAGVGQKELTNAVLNGGKALDEVRGKLADNNTFGSFFTGEGIRAGNATSEITKLSESVERGKGAFKDQQTALEGTAGASEEAAAGFGQVAASAEDATQAISDTANAIKGFNSAQLDVNSSQRDFEAAIDAVSDSVKENGNSLDVTTEKGRANAATLDSIAQSALNYSGALFQQTGSQDQATAALESGRNSLITALGQYGITGQAAQDYADKILGTPKDWATLFTNNSPQASASAMEYKAKLDALPAEKRTQVNAATAAAQSAIQNVLNTLAAIPSQKSVTITTNRVTVASKENTVGIFKASGGHVRGPGTETSDSIPAYLSDNEYVVKASSVRKYGTGFLDDVNAGRFADGGLVTPLRFASGGSVAAAQKRAAKARAAQQKARAAQLKKQQAAAAAKAKARAKARADAEAARLEKQTDIYQFRTSLRTGQLTGQSAVQAAFNIAQDSKFPERFRNAVARVADASEKKLIKLEKQSDRAADAVDKASDKLGDLRSASASMSSGISGKLSDFSYGNYRSGSSLLRGLTSRAGKLKQFQSLLVTLQKNGLAPALLNEVASLGVDEGLPLAKSLASMSKGQLSAINSQYGSINKTSTAIGDRVADANYGKLIATAEKQLSAANRNADQITKAISAESTKLQRLIGRALGVPGYSAGGYTGDGGASTIAGMVHGREFVVNQYATARNRGLLEAMNGGANVRYMDATRVVAAAPAAGARYEQHNHITPVQGVDPNTVTTVLGRELGRQFAGMVS